MLLATPAQCVISPNRKAKYYNIMKCNKPTLLSTFNSFGQLENITKLNVSDMKSKSFCNLLLFGSSDLDANTNKMIMTETILFIANAKRM